MIVHIIWGLQEQDRSGCHHTDYKCKGTTVFDKGYDVNPPPCQNAMLVSFEVYYGSCSIAMCYCGLWKMLRETKYVLLFLFHNNQRKCCVNINM